MFTHFVTGVITYHDWGVAIIRLLEHRRRFSVLTWCITGILHALVVHETLLFRATIMGTNVESGGHCAFIGTCWKSMSTRLSSLVMMKKLLLVLLMSDNRTWFQFWRTTRQNAIDLLWTLLRDMLALRSAVLLNDWFWWQIRLVCFKRAWSLLKPKFTVVIIDFLFIWWIEVDLLMFRTLIWRLRWLYLHRWNDRNWVITGTAAQVLAEDELSCFIVLWHEKCLKSCVDVNLASFLMLFVAEHVQHKVDVLHEAIKRDIFNLMHSYHLLKLIKDIIQQDAWVRFLRINLVWLEEHPYYRSNGNWSLSVLVDNRVFFLAKEDYWHALVHQILDVHDLILTCELSLVIQVKQLKNDIETSWVVKNVI